MRVAILIVLLSSSVWAQVNGGAKSSGPCSVAHNGNNDTITIENCGIGTEQADRITELIRQVLANQKSDSDRNAKLDALIDLAKQVLNPYGTVVTYQPNGLKRTVTPSTGSSIADTKAMEDFQSMFNKQQVKDWQGLMQAAQKAIDAYPGWFTPYYFLGFAQANLCMKSAASDSLTKFIADTNGASAYLSVRNDAQRILQLLDTDQFKLACPNAK